MVVATSLLVLACIVLIGPAGPTGCEAMSDGFIQFMTAQYGASTANAIARPDLVDGSGNCFGSFGGGANNVSQLTSRLPVLIVPDGASAPLSPSANQIPWAGNYTGVRDALYAQGYTASDVYAITWWDNHQLVDETLKCALLGQIRFAIYAIRAYTMQPTVNVIGYCLGSLLTRKAILGGVCVDTGTSTGPSYSSYVNHYVSVGSPNYGASLCSSYPYNLAAVCNTNNGVKCGSAWLNDLNKNSNPPGYEGVHVHSIYATNDQVIGDKPKCSAASGVCPAPGSPQHTGGVCAQASSNSLTSSAADPHYDTLIGSASIAIQVSIVMS
jgi:hypothetical protein